MLAVHNETVEEAGCAELLGSMTNTTSLFTGPLWAASGLAQFLQIQLRPLAGCLPEPVDPRMSSC